MKKKNNWLRALRLLIVFLLIAANSNVSVCLAEDDSSDVIDWVAYMNDDISDTSLNPGDTKEVTVPVTANYFQNIKKIRITTKDTPVTIVGTPKLYKSGVANNVTTIDQDNYFLKFTVKTSDTAAAGTYNLSITFVTGYVSLKSYTMEDTVPIYVKSSSEQSVADLAISDIKYTDDLSYKGTTNVTYVITNSGEQTAKNVVITYDGFSDDGVLPNGSDTTKKVSSIEAGAKKSYTFSVKGAANAVSGSKKLTIAVSYKNCTSATEKSTDTESFYITVTGKKTTTTTKTVTKAPKLMISNVKQSPQNPVAGGTVSLSFTLKNTGTRRAKNIMITPTSLTNTSFIPLDSEPYVYIKKMEIGDKQSITLNYKVSAKIEAGMNELGLAFTFKDSLGTDYSDTAKLYVTGIQSKKEDETGVPKLIIQSYGSSTEDIKAGSQFDFTFDVLNTHGTLSADNIKVTVSSEDGTFSVAKGSNSFYISKIKAGETVHKQIPLKVKADCTTKSYPIKIQFEYEYEGMEKPKDTLTSGLTISETLNLQVEEDPKPVLTNIIPGGYGEMVVGEANSVNFDFTNHGKSSLYNVEAVITGDFVPTQQSYFIGTVEAGGGKTHEMEITPQAEGTGEGTITITYEDSNGKQGKIKKKFTADIMPAGGSSTLSGDDGSGISGDLDNLADQTKKPIVKLPVFIIMQIVLFFAGMIITKKVLIRLKKNKLRRLEEEEN